MKKTFNLLLLLIIMTPLAGHTHNAKKSVDQLTPKKTGEVLDNPTLKNLSGSLSSWSFYSSFTYNGGSLKNPTSAERPNITKASERPSLQSLKGHLGIKYRLSKKDNFSLRVGTYMASPFHSSHSSENQRVQSEFDNNHQKLDIDDPKLSYFRTYHLGKTQNISFFTIEKTTKDILREYGLFGNISYREVSAFALTPGLYLAGSLNFVQYFFDKDVHPSLGVSLHPYQTKRVLKLNLSLEYYLRKNMAFRFISDVGTFSQMRNDSIDQWTKRDLQQTLAVTYFITRDISVAPNIRFILNDLQSRKTNLGLSFVVNI